MNRYSLFNANGELLAESDTAQGIADQAHHGTYSEDCDERSAWRFTAYQQVNNVLVGHPMKYRVDAALYCEKIGVTA